MNLLDTLMSYDNSTDNKNNIFGINMIVDILNELEGCKTRIKNLHWSSNLLMSYIKFDIHKQLDELLDDVIEYQDKVAEGGIGIYGDFGRNVIKGNIPDIEDPILLVKYIIDKICTFYSKLNDCCLIGLKSETEVFLQELYQKIYLFKLCKING